MEDFAYEGATIMIAPAAGFYSTPYTGTKQVRIAYVLNKESLQKSVKCLEEAESLPRKNTINSGFKKHQLNSQRVKKENVKFFKKTQKG